jgi:hypothetical protein
MPSPIRRSIIAARVRRWRSFLSGVAIGLACWFVVGYALANAVT